MWDPPPVFTDRLYIDGVLVVHVEVQIGQLKVPKETWSAVQLVLTTF